MQDGQPPCRGCSGTAGREYFLRPLFRGMAGHLQPISVFCSLIVDTDKVYFVRRANLKALPGIAEDDRRLDAFPAVATSARSTIPDAVTCREILLHRTGDRVPQFHSDRRRLPIVEQGHLQDCPDVLGDEDAKGCASSGQGPARTSVP